MFPSTSPEHRARILATLDVLEEAMHDIVGPMSVLLRKDFGKDPFLVLISCLLSLRARDTVTYPLCQKLFARVRTPEELVAIPRAELEELLRPIGFNRRKARIIQEVAAELLEKFEGTVPSDEEALLSLPGVGRKTMNLVRAEGFGIPAICVDTHVHRIANLLGWVATKTPEKTEMALRELLPQTKWLLVNRLLVVFGQQRRRVCAAVPPEKVFLLSPVC
jgi:endonuclease-3